jgi:hypothetical protein
MISKIAFINFVLTGDSQSYFELFLKHLPPSKLENSEETRDYIIQHADALLAKMERGECETPTIETDYAFEVVHYEAHLPIEKRSITLIEDF